MTEKEVIEHYIYKLKIKTKEFDELSAKYNLILDLIEMLKNKK